MLFRSYVNTIILPAADYPKEMYPEITYEIAPNLPLEIGQKIYSVLKDEQKARAVSQQGENFKFTPDISDTGKTLVLERYINDNLTGQSYYLKVKSFPPPEIIRYSLKEENTIRVETRSYGFHDGKENLVAEIILQGNAKSREIFGKIQRDQNKFIYIQEFEISRKNQSQPFILKFLAIDRRGIKSEEKQFP